MHKKQIKFFFHLINKFFDQMEDQASSENYKEAVVSRDNAYELVSEIKSYLLDMGYGEFDLKLPETITKESIEDLNKEINHILSNKVNPIEKFVDRLENGESLSTPTNMQFYNNNRVEIEAEMKKRSSTT